jgi:hypothetical protein
MALKSALKASSAPLPSLGRACRQGRSREPRRAAAAIRKRNLRHSDRFSSIRDSCSLLFVRQGQASADAIQAPMG